VAQGFSAKEIGRLLGTAPRTVERHIDNAKRKLDARNTSHLVARAFRLGILRPPVEASSAVVNDKRFPRLGLGRLSSLLSLCTASITYSPLGDLPLVL
jgi:hypothetical protein